jgi:hypothetical protein
MKKSNKKVMIYDPPSGWKYGFPKAVPENLEEGGFKQWILDQGYPEKDIDLALKYGRTWYEYLEEDNG